jgi:pantothenate kinase-related protein Tda10
VSRDIEFDRLLVDKLLVDISDIYTSIFKYEVIVEKKLGDQPRNLSISRTVVQDVCWISEQSMGDLRATPSHTISAVKNVCIVAFWISRLKPLNINVVERTDKGLKQVNEYLINEKIAIYWAILNIIRLFNNDKLLELGANKIENIKKFRIQANMLLKNSIYKHIDQKKSWTKYQEIAYHMRYKKISSVNLYDIVTTLLISCDLE